MDFSISQFEFGQRPAVTLPTPAFLEKITEFGIRKMVSDHYDLLSKSEIKHLFPRIDEALDKAKQRSSDFFIQICGGHPYFNENRGKPILAKRHAPFAITSEARIVWLKCYQEVLSKLDLPEETIQSFWNYLNIFSFWMVNTKENS
ncbi:MAG: globin [Bacteroidota bacterium]|nr:globin [Odoribacter sp.]MDP3644021.1 globin [Bacteroidota bacterium]